MKAGAAVGLVFALLVLGIIGMVVGATRGRAGLGFVLGFFCGPIGVLTAALLESTPAVELARAARLAIFRHGLPRLEPKDYATVIDEMTQLGVLTKSERELWQRVLAEPSVPEVGRVEDAVG